MFKTWDLFCCSSAEHSSALNTLLLAFTVIKIHRLGERSKCFSGWIPQITTSDGPLPRLPLPMFFCKSSLQRCRQMSELPCNKPVHFWTAVCRPCMILSCLNWRGMEWVGTKQLVHTVMCEKTWCSRSLYLVYAIVTCLFLSTCCVSWAKISAYCCSISW